MKPNQHTPTGAERAILSRLTTDGKVDHKRFIAEMQSRSRDLYGKPLDDFQLRLLAKISAAYEREAAQKQVNAAEP